MFVDRIIISTKLKKICDMSQEEKHTIWVQILKFEPLQNSDIGNNKWILITYQIASWVMPEVKHPIQLVLMSWSFSLEKLLHSIKTVPWEEVDKKFKTKLPRAPSAE